MKLEEVLAAASQGPASAAAMLDAREGEVTRELAAAAREAHLQAGMRRDINGAIVGALAARELYKRLGLEAEELRNQIDFHGLLYNVTDDPETYTELRLVFLDAIRRADLLGRADMAFDAAVLAAECALHAAMAGRSEVWTTAILQDTLAAARRSGDAPSSLGFERLVYLVSQAGVVAMTSTLIDDQHLLARELADWVQSTVPEDFAFTIDSTIDAQIAEALTALTEAF